MSDNYQAVYDAVRSRFSGFDGSMFIEAVTRQFDFSYMAPAIQQDIHCAIAEYARPSAVYRPALSQDGDKWCALYGRDLQEGCAGFGASPAEAMAAFDAAWNAKVAP